MLIFRVCDLQIWAFLLWLIDYSSPFQQYMFNVTYVLLLAYINDEWYFYQLKCQLYICIATGSLFQKQHDIWYAWQNSYMFKHKRLLKVVLKTNLIVWCWGTCCSMSILHMELVIICNGMFVWYILTDTTLIYTVPDGMFLFLEIHQAIRFVLWLIEHVVLAGNTVTDRVYPMSFLWLTEDQVWTYFIYS